MEFQALIFCGSGSNLSPFSAVKPTGIPKALLPVANRPMIEYVLEWCDRAPFKGVTVITNSSTLDQISACVEKYQERRDPEVVRNSRMECIASDETNTGSTLHSLKDKITSDFLILPCDFLTDIPPQVLIEVYRTKNDVNLGLGIFYNNIFEIADKKVLKSNYTVYANEDDGSTSLLDLYSKSSVALSKVLKIRTQLVWRYPNTSVSSSLLDSFIFFCRRDCIDILDTEKDLSSNKSATKIKRDLSRRSWKHSQSKETVGLFILPAQAQFARCNNLSVYMEVNRLFLKAKAKNGGGISAPKEKGAATVGADCIVGENPQLGEKTSVKRSVVGNNCTIGKKCRLTGCILLDNVVLEDDVQLENCIIGLNASVGSKSKLVNCYVEGSYNVSKGVAIKGETLVNLALEDDDGSAYSDIYSDNSDDDGDDDDDEDDDDISDDYPSYDEDEGGEDFFQR